MKSTLVGLILLSSVTGHAASITDVEAMDCTKLAKAIKTGATDATRLTSEVVTAFEKQVRFLTEMANAFHAYEGQVQRIYGVASKLEISAQAVETDLSVLRINETVFSKLEEVIHSDFDRCFSIKK